MINIFFLPLVCHCIQIQNIELCCRFVDRRQKSYIFFRHADLEILRQFGEFDRYQFFLGIHLHINSIDGESINFVAHNIQYLSFE